MNSAPEKRTTWVLLISGAMVLVGGGLVFAFIGGGTVQAARFGNDRFLLLSMIGAFIGAVGLAILTGALLWGVFFGEKMSGSKKLFQIPNVRIVARFAISEHGETLFAQNDIDFDNPKTDLRAKVQISPGQVSEFKCQAEVWHQAGEGMTGTAIVQRNWLCGFQPQIGGDPPV